MVVRVLTHTREKSISLVELVYFHWCRSISRHTKLHIVVEEAALMPELLRGSYSEAGSKNTAPYFFKANQEL